MSWIAVGTTVVSTAGSMYSANKAAKAAGKGAQVDIDALDEKARGIARRNAIESAQLERELTPEIAQLRTDSTNQISSQMNPSGWDEFSQGKLGHMANQDVPFANTPLLRAAIEKARSDLALGGKLDASTQNEVTRAGLSKAGTVGGGLGLGRDVVARDLGLSSLGLANQRLANASQLGGQELQLENSNIDTAFNNKANILNAVQALQGIQGNQFNRAMGAGQFVQGIQQPVVGLDPGAVVDLTVGNSNAQAAANANKANIAGQQSQNLMNLGGQAAGAAFLKYNNMNKGGGSRPADNGLSYV